ncbi:MAG: SMC-Scp complex subunit ScpB [Gammaproteobacteria bacterium]
MDQNRIKHIVEASLLAAGRPLSLEQLLAVFGEDAAQPTRDAVRAALVALEADCAGRSFELKQVASGWRIQVRTGYSEWVSRLWEERPSRYSRALLETLALIAYRQPITRGEIEDVRGVTVSTSIMKTLLEREWVRIVGHRDVPGRPALYGTTREFLDYFGLRSLDELPTLAELRDIDSLNVELPLDDPNGPAPEQEVHSAEEPATLDDDESEVAVGK